MIFSAKHIDKIIQKERKLQQNFQKDDYICECFKVVNRDLIKYFDSAYLLHKAYFLNEDGSVHPLVFKDVIRFQNDEAKKLLIAAEEEVRKGGAIPFTEILLRRSIPSIVLYRGKRPHPISRMLCQNLNEENYIRKLAGKLKVKQSGIRRLLKIYWLYCDKTDGPFYAYFIRPFVGHKIYNGVFLLLLKKPLKEQEFLEIRNLWTKILSETAVSDLERKTRHEEQESIFEEQTHTLHTEIGSIIQHLDNAVKKLAAGQGFPLDGISDQVEYAFFKTDQLRLINAFNLFLIKSKGFDSWDEILKNTSHDVEQRLMAALEPKEVILKSILLEAVLTLEQLMNSFRKNAELSEVPLLRLQLLNSLKSDLNLLPEHIVRTIHTGFYIIVLDLLKNALLHSDTNKPKVEITIHESKYELKIKFINNSVLSKEIFDYINDGITPKNISMRRKGGIRTIKRIIASPLLAGKNKQWKLRAERISLKTKTVIALIIPKPDRNGRD